MSSDNQWHISKSISVTFIFTVVAQTIGVVWFVSALRNDIDANSSELIRQETRVQVLEKVVQNHAVMLARIDENLKAIRSLIENGQ